MNIHWLNSCPITTTFTRQNEPVKKISSDDPPNENEQATNNAQPIGISEEMLTGPPFPLLLRLATPSALAFFVQASVSMAEIAYISELGTVSLAAIALMFPALMLMQTLANGAIGGSISSAIARSIGAGNKGNAEALIWHAIVIALVMGLLFYLIWTFVGSTILGSLGVSKEVQTQAEGYARILLGGSVLIWLMALLNATFRGMGNMKLPAALMIGGAFVNVPLSGALILGWFGLPAMGLEGAAIAVLVVAALNVLLSLVLLSKSKGAIRLHLGSFDLRKDLFADILRVGALASLSPVFTVLTVTLSNVLISGFGVAALAGFGIVARLEFLIIPLVFGLGAAMTAMVGTNVGAGNMKRAEHIGWLGGLSAAGLAGIVGIVLAFFPGLWIDLFTDDPQVWHAGATYLRIVGPSFAFLGLGMSLYFASQGAGTVFWPAMATLVRFTIGVGGAYLAVNYFGLELEAVYVCLSIAMVVFGVITAASLKFGAWRRA